MKGVRTTVICGAPVKFCNLNRPRDDLHPVCHRPPHEGAGHMSLAAVERSRQRQRERRRLARTRGQVLAA